MKQAQPLGQKMDQARARFRRAVESGEKAMEALQKAQENFEHAQQVIQAQTDLEAPLPRDACSTGQCEPGQNHGSFDRDH